MCQEDLIEWISKNLRGWSKRDIQDFYRLHKKTTLASIPKQERMSKSDILNGLCEKDLCLNDPTPIEIAMASELTYRGIEYKHQYLLGKYILDFAIITDNVKLDVECDGDEFHKRTRKQESYDRCRDQFVISQGWIPIRFSGRQITKNVSFCVQKIMGFL